MVRTVSYERQTLDTPNPIARFAQRARFYKAIDLLSHIAPPQARVLDYGCGTGQMLAALALERPDLELFGYDPYSVQTGESYKFINNIDVFEPKSASIVSCFETIEHLDEAERDVFLSQARRILKPNGVLVASVPIIGGPPLLLKEMNGIILHRRKPDYRLRELMAAVWFGVPAPRAANIKTSHKGFNFRTVEDLLRRDFEAVEMFNSPFRSLPWFLNSQIFFICMTITETKADIHTGGHY